MAVWEVIIKHNDGNIVHELCPAFDREWARIWAECTFPAAEIIAVLDTGKRV